MLRKQGAVLADPVEGDRVPNTRSARDENGIACKATCAKRTRSPNAGRRLARAAISIGHERSTAINVPWGNPCSRSPVKRPLRIRRRTPAHRRAVRAAPEPSAPRHLGSGHLAVRGCVPVAHYICREASPLGLPHTLAHSRAMQVSRFEQDATIQGFQGAERASVPRTLNSRNPGRGRRCRPGGRPDDSRHQHVEGRPRSDRIGTLRHSGEAISTTLHSLLSPAATTDTVI